MSNKIKEIISASIAVKQSVLADAALIEKMEKIADEIVNCYSHDGKVLFCGNGGSAADAQHIAAELSGRFYFDRDPLDAEALHVNTSYLTAVGNDYGYEQVYSRLVKARGRKGDVLVGLSTSGNSPNVIKAFELANEIGMITVGMTGESGGKMKAISRYLLNVPSGDTPRIQESHILMGHILCELVEEKMFERKK
jgi:D-sedoheptulose 7-phosphate isomerase